MNGAVVAGVTPLGSSVAITKMQGRFNKIASSRVATLADQQSLLRVVGRVFFSGLEPFR